MLSFVKRSSFKSGIAASTFRFNGRHGMTRKKLRGSSQTESKSLQYQCGLGLAGVKESIYSMGHTFKQNAIMCKILCHV